MAATLQPGTLVRCYFGDRHHYGDPGIPGFRPELAPAVLVVERATLSHHTVFYGVHLSVRIPSLGFPTGMYATSWPKHLVIPINRVHMLLRQIPKSKLISIDLSAPSDFSPSLVPTVRQDAGNPGTVR